MLICQHQDLFLIGSLLSKMHKYINDDDNGDDDYDDYDDHKHYKNYDITMFSKLSLWYEKHTT